MVGAIRLVSPIRARLTAPAAPPLTCEIEGGTVIEGGYLRESDSAGIKLLFNEGSKIVLTPGTRGRLRAVGNEGARVAIDHGTASFQVTPSNDRHWWVEVGPFLVAVKGTVFTVSWDPSSERFALSLRNGHVVVSGPLTGGDIALRAGQRLSVNLPQAETLITEDKPETSTVDDAAGASVPHVAIQPLPSPQSAVGGSSAVNESDVPSNGSSSRLDGKRRWADLLASGHWDGILADVERVGVKTTLDKASSEDLFSLATAARYRRRTDLARDALLAVRRRFADSPRSLDALFLLGRVEDSREGGEIRAIEWYDEYLALAAVGTYAAEALGRKMILTDEMHGRAEARPIAEEYLRRFPGGSYAGSARALCRLP
jgi:hypothetical protein